MQSRAIMLVESLACLGNHQSLWRPGGATTGEKRRSLAKARWTYVPLGAACCRFLETA